MIRPTVHQDILDNIKKEFELHSSLVLKCKGEGTFASTHEALGVITKEYEKVKEALLKPGNSFSVKHELYDLAFACIFTASCLENGEMDW